MSSLSIEDLGRYGDVAGRAVRLTGDILNRRGRPAAAPLSQIGRDIKLDEDARSEAVIRAFLQEQTPFPVLGEEAGWGDGGAEGTGPCWVVDPLDGSFNYFRGIPLYSVSIALCEGRTALVGAIYDPERDELFTGGAGLGFSVNGEVVRPEGTPRQMLSTGFPAKADIDATVARIGMLAREWTKIRMIGSAALSLAWVAAGRFDGYAEAGTNWWDVAAGLALCEGAGVAVVTIVPRDGHVLDVLVER